MKKLVALLFVFTLALTACGNSENVKKNPTSEDISENIYENYLYPSEDSEAPAHPLYGYWVTDEKDAVLWVHKTTPEVDVNKSYMHLISKDQVADAYINLYLEDELLHSNQFENAPDYTIKNGVLTFELEGVSREYRPTTKEVFDEVVNTLNGQVNIYEVTYYGSSIGIYDDGFNHLSINPIFYGEHTLSDGKTFAIDSETNILSFEEIPYTFLSFDGNVTGYEYIFENVENDLMISIIIPRSKYNIFEGRNTVPEFSKYERYTYDNEYKAEILLSETED